MIKASCSAFFCLLVASGVHAQETEAVSIQEASAQKATPLQKVLKAKPDEMSKALIAFIEDQIASNAIYSGQYSGLAPVKDPAAKLIHEWAIDAPLQVLNADSFRNACINALRDLYGKEAPEEVIATMKEIAKDDFESRPVKENATYALGQFGDRSLVDTMLKNAEAATKHEDPRRQAAGYQALATVNYNMRAYEAAVKAYQGLIGLAEAGKIDLGRSEPVTYYNCACSMALGGQTDKAMEYLGKAFEKDKGHQLSRRLLDTDMDIASLRKDPRFAEMVKAHFEGGGTTSRKAEKKEADKKKSQ